MTPAVLVYNPAAGRHTAARRLPAILDALAGAGYAVRALPTAGPGDATCLAAEAAQGGEVEVAFAMGGDGTLREVAAGLLGSEVALGLLPQGTANVLAIALGVPRDPLAAARAAGGYRLRPFDVGTVTGGDGVAEPFLMMVSAGVDAAVMAAQDPRWKRRLGRAGILVSGLGAFLRYRYPEIVLEVDGRRETGGFFTVSNIPCYGGALRIAPAADPADGRLDLVLHRGRGRAATLGFARDLLLGRHLRRDDVWSKRVEEVTVLGPSDLATQLDGDVLGRRPPYRIGVRPGVLRVLVPVGDLAPSPSPWPYAPAKLP